MRTRTRYRRVLMALCALALLSRAPALVAPPALDDHVQAAMAEARFPAPRAPWDLYAFARDTPADRAALRAEGTLPWWTADDYKLVMFRPLASALVALDHRVLRHWSLARAHSAAWLVGLLLALAAMVRRVVGERAALVAVGLVAVDDALTTPLAWHANRCALQAIAVALLAVDAFARFGDGGRRRDLAAGVALAALACLFGEYAWTILPAALLLPGVPAPRRRGLTASVAALALAYVVARSSFGAGVRGCVLYPDLARDLPLLLFIAPRVWSLMLADLLAGVGVEVPPPWLGLVGARAALALVGGALLAVAWRSTQGSAASERARRWALRAGLASLVVVSTAWLSARLLLGASIWAGVMLGALAERATRRPVGAVAFASLLALHGPIKAWSTWRGAERHLVATRASWRGADALLDGVSDVSTVYVVNALDPEEVYFGRYTRASRGHPPTRGWFVLSSTPARVHIYREAPRVISLVARAGLVEGLTARFFRSSGRWPATGHTARLGDATLTVVEAGPQGVLRVRVRFDMDLDDPAIALVWSTRSGLRRFTVPPVGSSVEVGTPRLSAPPR